MMSLTRPAFAYVFAIAMTTSTGPIIGAENATAAAPEILFGAAAEGRAYWALAERFKEAASARDLTVDIVETQGSLENLRRLAQADDPLNLALTQADAMRYLLGERPEVGRLTGVVESIGLECVFAVTAADGPIATEADWQRAQAPRVAVQAQGSGPAITHRHIGQLVPEVADDVQSYMDLSDALNALHVDGKDRVDLVLQVHRPKYATEQTEAAITRPDLYRILSLRDPRLKAQLPSGEEVYEFLEVPLLRRANGDQVSVPTICTKGLLVAAPAKLSATARDKLERILDFDWMKIYPEESRWLR
jgi:hypothetical protein